MKTGLLTLIVILAGLATVGCDNNERILYEEIYVYNEDNPPPVPQGVYSVTGDGEVLLHWLPIDDINGDFDTYIVYRSDFHPDTGYIEIGQTRGLYFIDDNVVNSHTYFYAVSSVDFDGNLSDLSYELVFDTPRPEGYNRALFDFNSMPQYAGWDLSEAAVVDYQSVNCDFFLEYFAGDGVYYFNVGNIDTDIQDMGFTYNFDEIDFAPDSGWSANGWCEVIEGHSYVIWTADNHFAKIRVTAINASQVVFDWAYQRATGNLELKPLVGRTPDYLRNPDGGA